MKTGPFFGRHSRMDPWYSTFRSWLKIHLISVPRKNLPRHFLAPLGPVHYRSPTAPRNAIKIHLPPFTQQPRRWLCAENRQDRCKRPKSQSCATRDDEFPRELSARSRESAKDPRNSDIRSSFAVSLASCSGFIFGRSTRGGRLRSRN